MRLLSRSSLRQAGPRGFSTRSSTPLLAALVALAAVMSIPGCSVVGATVAVGSAAVSAVSTVGSAAVSVASTTVEAAYDVTKAGVNAVTGSDSAPAVQ